MHRVSVFPSIEHVPIYEHHYDFENLEVYPPFPFCARILPGHSFLFSQGARARVCSPCVRGCAVFSWKCFFARILQPRPPCQAGDVQLVLVCHIGGNTTRCCVGVSIVVWPELTVPCVLGYLRPSI